MKSVFRMLLTGALVMFLTAFSCGQNGPTPASITVGFTQAATTSTSGPVVANCIYVGTASGKEVVPGTCSSGPVTSFTINSNLVRGQQYFIEVTAQFQPSGKLTEGPFSNEVSATPPVLNAPSVGTPTSAQLHPQVPVVMAKAGQISGLHIVSVK